MSDVEFATPFQLHRTFDYKVRGFPESVYSFGPHDHLTNLMRVLLDDPGVGQLLKMQTAARLSETLGGTQFGELDYFFGSILRFPRLAEEVYPYDPFVDQLTAEEWREVENKDAEYRERISLFLQAVGVGGTVEGIAMAAEAACGYECMVLESWRYNENLGLGTYAGRVAAANREIVIVPDVDTLDGSRRRAIYQAVEKIKPANVIVTVDEDGLAVRQVIVVRHIASPSEYFEIRKHVTGVNPPAAPPSDKYYWITDGVEVEARSFAHLRRMEQKFHLNNSVTKVEVLTEDADGIRYALPSGVAYSEEQFGPWREIDLADSPDNYPEGKFPGDSSKYDDDGNYVWAWGSQAEYAAWIQQSVVAIGGEFSGSRFRLLVEYEIPPTETSDPMDSLAPTRVEIQTMYYAR